MNLGIASVTHICLVAEDCMHRVTIHRPVKRRENTNILFSDLAFKVLTGLRDIARAARRDRDVRNTRFRVEHTQHKGQICILRT